MYYRSSLSGLYRFAFSRTLVSNLILLVACGGGDKSAPKATQPSIEIKCKDGLDNDKDGKADCDDTDCLSPGGDCRPAPALDRTVASTLGETAAFLYTGDNPLQKAADPKAFDPKRVAMLHGRILGASGASLAGVRVEVQGHREYGYTYTRADGAYDLAVNGGSRLLLEYSMDGDLPAQRATLPGWQRHVTVDDIGLVPAEGKTTTLAVDAAESQTITGNEVVDANGQREPFIVFEPGTVAHAVLPDGSKEPLSTLSVTVTEYPLTDTDRFLPGSPGATTGVSYALNFEVAEARKLGASHVVFSEPVSMYVENFLGLPVGSALPMTTYDRASGQWEQGQIGRVIQVLAVTEGAAQVDCDGDVLADDTATLAALGITPSDLKRLGERYVAGTELWCGKIAHFSDVKAKPQLTAPRGAVAPSDNGLRKGWLDTPSRIGTILVEPQSISQAIPITGTPYSLEYQSLRAKGYGVGYQLELPLTGLKIPPGLKRINYRARVAGKTYEATLGTDANQRPIVTWDGTDNHGRLLQSPQLAEVYIGYVYEGAMPNGKKPTKPADVTLGDTFYVKMGLWDAKAYQIGGFAIDVLHAYDPAIHTIYFGYGDQRSADNVALVAKPANLDTTFSVGTPDSVFIASDGSLIVTDDQQQDDNALGRVLRVTPDGKPSVIAGPGAAGAAAAVRLIQPQGVVGLDDGSLVVADYMEEAVRSIDPSGTMTTLISGYAKDSPLVSYPLATVDGLVLGPRQELYIVDSNRVLVYEAGKLSHIAGGGTETADGGLATNTVFMEASGVAVGRDGSIYVSERAGNRVRKVLTDGTIVTVAGTGVAGFNGDGALAIDATLNSPRGLALGPDGSLYVVDQGNDRIRRVTGDGIIQTVIGGGKAPIIDGRLATQVALNDPDGIAVGPDGSLYVATYDTVFRVSPALPTLNEKDYMIPSSDGRTLYKFDKRGKHLATLDAMTGVTELAFRYDAAGLLATITDKDGLVTTIARNADGVPFSITGPYGQVTKLDIRADGNVAEVTDPIGRVMKLEWDPTTGLLGKVTDPKGTPTTFGYDGLAGRLTSVTDPTGDRARLTPSLTTDGYLSVSVTSQEGKTASYLSRSSASGVWQRAVSAPDGSRSDSTETASNHLTSLPDGTKLATYMEPDVAFGPQSMVPNETTTTLPSGKTLTSLQFRGKTVTDISNPLLLERWHDQVEINGRVYATTYLRGGRTVTTTSPMGRTSTTTLDELGRPVTLTSSGMPTVSWTYDADGRVAIITETAGTESRSEVRGYGADGWLSSRIDTISRTTTYAWDPVGRPATITRPDGKRSAWTFDLADNVTSFTVPDAKVHAFSYEQQTNLLTLATPPALAPVGAAGLQAGQESYLYGSDHELLGVTRSDGRSVQLTYDQAGRLTDQAFGGVALAYGYDARGTLTSVNRSDSVKVESTHDGYLWTGTTWSGVVSGSVKAAYDANFWLQSVTVNDASTVSFAYDDDGMIVGASATPGRYTIVRDPNTGMVTETSLNGGVSTALGYNAFAELKSLTAIAAPNSTIFDQTLERDKVGHVTHIAENVQGVVHDLGYTYDLLGRLETATRDGVATTYGYDSNGNRNSLHVGASGAMASTHDAQDRILTQGTATFEFTPHGDLLRKTDGTSTTELAYDELGNLLKATVSAAGAARTVEYVVDGLGRRVASKLSGVFDRAWLYRDDLRPISEVDAGGTFTHYVYVESQGGAPDFMIRSGVLHRLVKDHLGSVRLVVNAQTGAVVQALEYDAYGVVLTDTNPGFQPFGFAGGLYDAVTGLVRFGARDYDASIGRWTNKDPSGFAGGDTNVYAYVGGDPVNLVDPDGRHPVVVALVTGAGIVLATSDEEAAVVAVAAVAEAGVVASGVAAAVTTAVAGAARAAAKPIARCFGRLFGRGAAVAAKALRFGETDLVYGPSARGALRKLQESAGGRLLTDVGGPASGQSWTEFSIQTMKNQFAGGGRLRFDLTHMEDISGALSNTGKHAGSTTAQELRWIQSNWGKVGKSVSFYRNGVEVVKPW